MALDVNKELALLESINDAGILHAVFLAGGPGSGKSFIAKKAFAGTGARVVNSDISFEFLLKKNNLPMKFDPEGQPEIYARQMVQRSQAKGMRDIQLNNWVNGLLALIVDGTGADYSDIADKKRDLEARGYDCYMLFVNTSLEVARQRNQERDRTVADAEVVRRWNAVQSNMGKFQSLFGQGFKIVDNSDELTPTAEAALSLTLARYAQKLLDRPVKNPVGVKNIAAIKAVGGKYLSDLK